MVVQKTLFPAQQMWAPLETYFLKNTIRNVHRWRRKRDEAEIFFHSNIGVHDINSGLFTWLCWQLNFSLWHYCINTCVPYKNFGWMQRLAISRWCSLDNIPTATACILFYDMLFLNCELCIGGNFYIHMFIKYLIVFGRIFFSIWYCIVYCISLVHV